MSQPRQNKIGPEGFVKLYRRSFESIVWKNPKLWRFWTWALMKATHRKYTALVGYQEVELQPGQFVTGRNKAVEETGLTSRQWRTCRALLEKHQKLTSKTTNKYTIITIVNWDTYQHSPKEKRPAKRPANDQQTTTYKNYKNIKNKKRSKTGFLSDDFESMLSND